MQHNTVTVCFYWDREDEADWIIEMEQVPRVGDMIFFSAEPDNLGGRRSGIVHRVIWDINRNEDGTFMTVVGLHIDTTSE